MAKVALVLDDVVLALKKGKRQVAEEKANLSIPATMSPNGKRRNLRLDVSDEGKELLDSAFAERDKLLEKVESDYQKGLAKLQEEKVKAEKDAWKELNKIADKVEETRPTRQRKKEDKNEDSASDSTDSNDTQYPVNNDDSATTDTQESSDTQQNYSSYNNDSQSSFQSSQPSWQ